MISTITMIIMSSMTYFEAYEKESQDALLFVRENKETIRILNNYLSQEDSRIAMCIVAPEISQYSKIADTAETFALYTLYVQGQVTNFSIGSFQMKPTFAINIENEVKKSSCLSNYRDLIIDKNTDREIRYERVERLSSLKWQLKYLSAFIEIVKERTSKMIFKNQEEKLRYWATLYNAGIYTKESRILSLYEVEGFPSFSTNSFNYAEVCIEFYRNKEFCDYLK